LYGQQLACVYFEGEPGRRSAAHLLPRDEARRIAANIAKMSEHRPLSTHFRYDLNSGHFAGLRSPTSWANRGNARRCGGFLLTAWQSLPTLRDQRKPVRLRASEPEPMAS
jgi:hypothetical protein